MIEPSRSDMPVNNPVVRKVEAGARFRVKYTPSNSGSTFVMPILAISKFPGMTYEIEVDGQTRYGQAPIPPTDVDDLQRTFYPPLEWSRSLTVTVRNVGASDRRVVVQPIGWEKQ